MKWREVPSSTVTKKQTVWCTDVVRKARSNESIWSRLEIHILVPGKALKMVPYCWLTVKSPGHWAVSVLESREPTTGQQASSSCSDASIHQPRHCVNNTSNRIIDGAVIIDLSMIVACRSIDPSQNCQWSANSKCQRQLLKPIELSRLLLGWPSRPSWSVNEWNNPNNKYSSFSWTIDQSNHQQVTEMKLRADNTV
jgi:hypothetical protein